MVAPVRETAAQLLAVAALQLDGAGLRQTANLLSELTVADEWQPRHGGFCGLESLCAVAIGGENAGRGGGAPSCDGFHILSRAQLLGGYCLPRIAASERQGYRATTRGSLLGVSARHCKRWRPYVSLGVSTAG